MTETEFASSVSDIPRCFQGHFAGSCPAALDSQIYKDYCSQLTSSFHGADLFLLQQLATIMAGTMVSTVASKQEGCVAYPIPGPVGKHSLCVLRFLPTVQKHADKVS